MESLIVGVALWLAALWVTTRLGTASTGNDTVIPSFFFATLQPTARASQRVAPTTNFVDDLTWTKSRHTVQLGANMRFVESDRISFNNLPNYSYSRNTLLGLVGPMRLDHRGEIGRASCRERV